MSRVSTVDKFRYSQDFNGLIAGVYLGLTSGNAADPR